MLFRSQSAEASEGVAREEHVLCDVERNHRLGPVNHKRKWRTEPTSVEKGGDEVWIAEKFQSNSEIAGSPRNSFRASLELESNGGKALN